VCVEPCPCWVLHQLAVAELAGKLMHRLAGRFSLLDGIGFFSTSRPDARILTVKRSEGGRQDDPGGGQLWARLWRTGRTKPTLSSFKTRCAPLLAMDLRLGYEPLTALLLSAH